ncbi:hypothetical protein DPM19_12365 [Actinomadura craniellae]|uniref:Uncharacterized protein n=1 Tax=Actinomadura craniellae TaxID=2231787 RepID=A0A365H8H4_9ACTN|nr:hypothetical protein [Actinomadura craniellae]RAY14563.1 hypothetical protein DPM19_12365 [Actinomadura craniellae]
MAGTVLGTALFQGPASAAENPCRSSLRILSGTALCEDVLHGVVPDRTAGWVAERPLPGDPRTARPAKPVRKAEPRHEPAQRESVRRTWAEPDWTVQAESVRRTAREEDRTGPDLPSPAPAEVAPRRTGMPWLLGGGLPALFLLFAGTAFVGRRRLGLLRPADHEDSSVMDLHALPGLVLAGPGGEDAARHMVIDALVRTDEHIEVIIDQADAEHLLEAGPEAEDRFPYLVITAGPAQTRSYLETPGPYRLVITSGDGADLADVRQATIVALTPGAYPPVEVAEDGAVTVPPGGPALPARLPVLPLPEACARLHRD